MKLRLSLTLAVLAFAMLAPSAVRAAGIVYTCDPSIDAAVAGTCATLNGAVAGVYATAFSNANASIYIQYGITGLGESTSGFLNLVTYSAYLAALTAHQGPGSIDPAAVASLPVSEPAAFTGGNVEVTSALAAALGITKVANGGDVLGLDVLGHFCNTPGSGGCYNGVITLATPAIVAGYGQSYYYRSGAQAGNAYDIFTIVEHETDEILGSASCVDTNASLTHGCGSPGNTNPAAVDLFRYSAGSRIFLSSSPGYFSYNGGVTDVANYNSTANGEDYADWSTNCAHVQDATGCPGQSFDITNDGNAEIAVLDAVGFNQNADSGSTVPEPTSLILFGSGLAVIIARIKRRQT
jgi:hypothetical protein